MNSTFTNRQQTRVGGVIQQAVLLLTDPQMTNGLPHQQARSDLGELVGNPLGYRRLQLLKNLDRPFAFSGVQEVESQLNSLVDLLGKSFGVGKVGLDDRRSFPD